MKPRNRRNAPLQGREGPRLLIAVVVLVAAALVGARFLGFDASALLVSLERVTGSTPDELVSIDVTQRDGGTVPVDRSAPRVLIYHAHASENYAPNPTHARAGTPGDVVEVGKALAAALEARGIRTIHVSAVYDNPWGEAYTAAARAVSQVLEANPSIELVLDVHRDAVEQRQEGIATVQLNGTNAAKVLLTVGEVNNPHVQANAALATKMKEQLDQLYPGLSRGIRMFKQESNGHLHPNALEVHVGDYYDTDLEEALATARYLADVIAAVLD